MTIPAARLAFFKLNVPDANAARTFWEDAFGFAVTQTYDEDSFVEHIMALPGQAEAGPSLMLVESKPARDVSVGPGHGPLGLVCDDIAASHAHAVQSGATSLMDPLDVGGVIVSMLKSPQGHEIELVQPLG
ncbi:VOC family protein [Aurantiacibacter odishensis]|uniref:VOC family protein n=1 Tax=Aurantiacibacter odishensis TaxID=1155476 RepID=UPI0013C4B46F|nr:VOC family protein [Aurantiacibacter odishensis]